MKEPHPTESDPDLEGLEPLLSIDAVAAYLGVPVATIDDWRVDGRVPRAVRIGRHLKFLRSDVRGWVATRRETVPGLLPDSMARP